MALQPLSLVPAAYRPLGTNQRLCSGDTAGLPRSRLPPLFSPLWLGLVVEEGRANHHFDQLLSSPGPWAQWVSPRGRQYQWSQLIFLQVPCVVSPYAISLQHDQVGRVMGRSPAKPHGNWVPGALALSCSQAARPSLAKREKEASGVRMRKVLSKAYTRRTRLTLSLWRGHVWACHPGPQEAMEARQKQARSLLPRGRPGVHMHKCTSIPAGETHSMSSSLFARLLSQIFLFSPRPATLLPT